MAGEVRSHGVQCRLGGFVVQEALQPCAPEDLPENPRESLAYGYLMLLEHLFWRPFVNRFVKERGNDAILLQYVLSFTSFRLLPAA